MHRVITVVAVSLGILVVAGASTPGWASSDCGVGAGRTPGGIATSVIIQGSCVEPEDELPVVRVTSELSEQEQEVEPEPVWALEPLWGVHGETGEPCIDLVESSSVTVNEGIGLEWEARMLAMLHDERLASVEFRWCRQGPVVPVDDPSPAAHAFVRTIVLPQPHVWVAPGYGLTGMPAFLEVSGQQRFEVESQVVGFGQLSVRLAPVSLVVDWGDGTVEQVDDGRLGAPFDGRVEDQVSHTYLWPDEDVVVSVTVRWTAVWELGGFTGVVDDLEVTGQIDLPVATRRATRIRGFPHRDGHL